MLTRLSLILTCKNAFEKFSLLSKAITFKILERSVVIDMVPFILTFRKVSVCCNNCTIFSVVLFIAYRTGLCLDANIVTLYRSESC
ncbi:hypothetical protein XELAEV_18044851mg [Xenopus laevis]|uniref:Uncharacterized protein n=1 Tax=Xenopus laevis TaxID=8355 RepID=A0A974H472_XENLA|nr:hypothetical protein XELAEV_18044851mg [Xenopus laevis]